MSKDTFSRKIRYAIIGSVLLNIILLAFVLGHLSMSPASPPPKGAMALPGIVQGGRMPPRRTVGGDNADMPLLPPVPPPFYISPADLFTPEEMRQDFNMAQQNLEKMRDLRQAMATRMKEGPMGKEEVREYFNQTEQLMHDTRQATQALMAKKISALPEEDRLRLAEKLAQEQRSSGASFAPGNWPPRPANGVHMPDGLLDGEGRPAHHEMEE